VILKQHLGLYQESQSPIRILNDGSACRRPELVHLAGVLHQLAEDDLHGAVLPGYQVGCGFSLARHAYL
jgi:hypothetical protein